MSDDQVQDKTEDQKSSDTSENLSNLPDGSQVSEPENKQSLRSDDLQNDTQANEPENSDVPTSENSDSPASDSSDLSDSSDSPSSDLSDSPISSDLSDSSDSPASEDDSGARWYVVHTYSGHENKVAAGLKQRIESEHLEDKIMDILVPTQEKIEIRGGKKETVKEKIFPGYILVKMILDDESWLAVRTTQGVTSFIGMSSKPTPIPAHEVQTIVKFMKQGGQPTYKQIFSEGDTVKIIDGPFAEFIGKIDSVDKEKGKVKVLVSIFGRETPVELDFLQIAKL